MTTKGILYAAVARQNAILVSSQRGEGDFEATTNFFLPSVPVETNTKTCFSSDTYFYHVLVEDMLIYICVAETEFGRKVPYAFLNEVKQQFNAGSLGIRALRAHEHAFDRDFSYILDELLEKYSSSAVICNIDKVRGQVNEVMVVMNDNIQKVCERGEKLETLIDKTADLELCSSQFRSTATKVRRKMWFKNFRMWIIIAVLVIAIITVIALLATNVIPVKAAS